MTGIKRGQGAAAGGVAPEAAAKTEQPADSKLQMAGDDVGKDLVNPFQLHFSAGFREWLAARAMAVAFSTYQAGKVVIVGPGLGEGLAISERNFGRAMAFLPTPSGFYLSTSFQVWRFENSLPPGARFGQWDRVYLPRACHVTGAVDIHDLAIGSDGDLLACVTQYNCIASLDPRGSFNPLWRPPFIDRMVGEDRCHLNGFCLEGGELAYATAIAPCNEAGAWKARRADGGLVFDLKADKPLAEGLAMPHTPRLYRGELYLLEAGSGWFGKIDRQSGAFQRIMWLPGFLRGLRFFDDYAVIGLSKPRDETFQGLPLDEALKKRGLEPVCGVYIVDLRDGSIAQTVTITGSVTEIYDVALIGNSRAPFLAGLQGEETARLVFIGPDSSARPEPIGAQSEIAKHRAAG